MIESKEELDNFIDFMLKDIDSNILKQYIKDKRELISQIKDIVNNDKITGIEAKLIIKDILNKE